MSLISIQMTLCMNRDSDADCLHRSHICLRLELLETQLSRLKCFDQELLIVTKKSEHYLSDLRSTSLVDIANLQAAFNKLKVSSQ